MDMKTTIIELLNKLSKGEEMPKTIMFRGEQYYFSEGNYAYAYERWLFDDFFETLDILNEDVEIIEETEEIDIDRAIIIEKDNSNREFIKFKNNGATGSGYSCDYSILDLIFAKAIKQIINKIKELEGQSDE